MYDNLKTLIKELSKNIQEEHEIESEIMAHFEGKRDYEDLLPKTQFILETWEKEEADVK